MKKLLFILLLFLNACTCAGPFVTNISTNKDGSFTVEKCVLEHNAFSGTISIKNCTLQKI